MLFIAKHLCILYIPTSIMIDHGEMIVEEYRMFVFVIITLHEFLQRRHILELTRNIAELGEEVEYSL